MVKIQSKLKAALYGTDAFTYFSRHDKDESGEWVAEYSVQYSTVYELLPHHMTIKFKTLH